MNSMMLYGLLTFSGLLAGALTYLLIRYERLKNSIQSEQDHSLLLEEEKTLNKNLLEQNKVERDAHEALLSRSDAMGFPIWMRNEQLHIVYYNKCYADIAGILPGIATVTELCDGTKDLAASVLEKGQRQHFKEHLIVEGERQLFNIIETPVNDQKNDASTLGYALPMKELEDKEQELELLMNAQSTLMESTSHAIAIYDSAMTLKFYNDAFVRMWALDEIWLDSEPSYGDVLERLREERKLPEQADFREFKKQSLSQFNNLLERQENFYYLPDEKIFRVVTIPHGHGGLIFSYEDMTEHVTLERKYNTLISVKKSTIDHLFEGIVVYKQNGRMQLCNPAFARMWNLHQSFLDTDPHITDVCDKIMPLLPSDIDDEAYKAELFDILEKRENSKKRIKMQNGTIIDRITVPLPDGDTLMTYTNVTDSTRLEESLRAEKQALEEAATLKTTFLSNISYELRSPLTSIIGFSEALLKKYFGELEPKQEEYIDNIHASSIKLSSLIDNVLEITAFDAGTIKLNKTIINANALLQTIEHEYIEPCKKQHVSLSVSCDEGVNFMGDKRRLSHALCNLLENSLQHTSEDDTISLSGRYSDDRKELILEVKDTGSGITIEDQLSVFNRFYKSNTLVGVGLGLPIVKAFAELHGGDVDLQSTPNGGTTVSLYLPIEEQLT